MFVRYLGGGIGHLDQFPPAHNDDEDTTAHDKNVTETETDDFGISRNSKDRNSNEGDDNGTSSDNESDNDPNDDNNDSDDDHDDPDDDGVGAGEDEDAEEDMDEETGNIY
jgi:hypothetical protein